MGSIMKHWIEEYCEEFRDPKEKSQRTKNDCSAFYNFWKVSHLKRSNKSGLGYEMWGIYWIRRWSNHLEKNAFLKISTFINSPEVFMQNKILCKLIWNIKEFNEKKKVF